MNKSDLVAVISHRAGIPTNQADKVVNAFLDAIKSGLQTAGSSVTISGFGKFVVKERAARKGRNPLTNQPVDIPPKQAIVFKPSEKLKHAQQ